MADDKALNAGSEPISRRFGEISDQISNNNNNNSDMILDFNKIPDDVLKYLIEFLHENDLVVIQRVNKKWREYISNIFSKRFDELKDDPFTFQKAMFHDWQVTLGRLFSEGYISSSYYSSTIFQSFDFSEEFLIKLLYHSLKYDDMTTNDTKKYIDILHQRFSGMGYEYPISYLLRLKEALDQLSKMLEYRVEVIFLNKDNMTADSSVMLSQISSMRRTFQLIKTRIEVIMSESPWKYTGVPLDFKINRISDTFQNNCQTLEDFVKNRKDVNNKEDWIKDRFHFINIVYKVLALIGTVSSKERRMKLSQIMHKVVKRTTFIDLDGDDITYRQKFDKVSSFRSSSYYDCSPCRVVFKMYLALSKEELPDLDPGDVNSIASYLVKYDLIDYSKPQSLLSDQISDLAVARASCLESHVKEARNFSLKYIRDLFIMKPRHYWRFLRGTYSYPFHNGNLICLDYQALKFNVRFLAGKSGEEKLRQLSLMCFETIVFMNSQEAYDNLMSKSIFKISAKIYMINFAFSLFREFVRVSNPEAAQEMKQLTKPDKEWLDYLIELVIRTIPDSFTED
jgi:hypothetical protein